MKIKKNQNQLKKKNSQKYLKMNQVWLIKKFKKFVLLKDKLDFIFKNFDSNFNSTGKNFLTKLAKDEKKIDYNNLFFEIDDKSAVKSVDFLEEFVILYDLWIYLLDNCIKIISSTKAQTEFLEVITALKITISNIKTDMTDQSEEQKKILQNKRVF